MARPAAPRRLGPALALLALALVVYAPALRNGYVNFDDGTYIVVNRHLNDLAGLRHIWTGTRSRMYYPLVFTSFWLEKQLQQALGIISPAQPPDPHLNHAINIVLHGLAGILLWRCLLRLGLARGPAWFAAALWLVHPLQTESVVWAVERKNTLAGLFCFASVLMYLRARGRTAGGAYPASLLLFACALLSKSAFLLLPVTLLALEWLQARRLRAAAALRLLPFLALAMLFALLTVRGEHRAIIRDIPPLPARLLVAGIALWFYLAKLIAPVGLAVIYPRWTVPLSALSALPLLLALAGGLTVLLYALRQRRSRAAGGALAATAHYLATLAPALGLIPFGYLELSFVANHFLYVPLAGPIVLLALGLAAAGRRLGPRRVAPLLAAGLLAALGASSFRRALPWKDTVSLAREILARNPRCAHALGIYALEIEHQQPARALQLMRQAVAARPENLKTRIELARLLEQAARQNPPQARTLRAAAVRNLRAALRAAPGLPRARWLLARTLAALGDFRQAVAQLEALPPAYQQNPALLDTWARCESHLGHYQTALAKARRALKLAPQQPTAYLLVASLLLRLGRYQEAIGACNRLLSLQPRSVRALLLRGQCYQALGRTPAAERDFQAALTIAPQYRPAVRQLRQHPASRPAAPRAP